MNPKKLKKRGPESILEEKFEMFMRARGWYVKKMHGSAFQSGFPDYFCCHSKYGIRLVELKDPNRKGEPFTGAQLAEFPKMSANGAPIYVITAATETEYDKLFKPQNWYQFLGVMR